MYSGLGSADASFARCGPIESSISVMTFREAGALIPIKDPDEVAFGDVTLERGASRNPLFAAWMRETIEATTGVGQGRVVPDYYKRTVAIYQQNRRKHGNLKKIILLNCLPTGFRAGDWDNSTDGIVIEALTLTYDYYLIKLAEPD